MSDDAVFNDALPAGTRIGELVLGEAIGQGGEGIIYRARHDQFGEVAVKEYFPKTMVSRLPGGAVVASAPDLKTKFAEGISKFIDSGNQIISLPRHPNIMECWAVFEHGKTAYLVMSYIKGPTLKEKLAAQNGYGDVVFVIALAQQLTSALEFLHARKIRHRDIAPDNIIIEARSGKAVLIDFSMAKLVVVNATISAEAMGKPGYSPIEQFSGVNPPPTLDIYATSAVLYHAISGVPPQDATSRSHEDTYRALSSLPIRGYPGGFLEAIDHGLARLARNRPATVEQWHHELFGNIVGGDWGSPANKPKAPPASPPPLPPSPPRATTVKATKQPEQEATEQLFPDPGEMLGCFVLFAITAAILWAIYHFWWAAPYADMTQVEEYQAPSHRSVAQLQTECDSSNFASCARLGWHYVSQPSKPPKDAVKALGYFQKACKGEFMPGCILVGRAHEIGDGVSQNSTIAVKFFKMACDGHSAPGCRAEGRMYWAGPGHMRDEERGVELFEIACDGGDMAGCNLLGEAYSQARGVSVDKSKAAELFQKACDGGNKSGCASLGMAYNRGEGVETDYIKAANAYTLACDKGDARGCYGLAWSVQNGKGRDANPKEAFRLYSKSCDGGSRDGCTGLAYMLRAGSATPPDHARALALFSRSCNDGAQDACNGLGESHMLELGALRNQKLEFKLFRQACLSGISKACFNAGVSRLEGNPDKNEVDYVKKYYFGPACRGGVKAACDRVPDPLAETKRGLNIIGCEVGLDSACDAKATQKN